MNIAWGNLEEAAQHVGATLARVLETGPVLWLISGGSSVKIEIAAMAHVSNTLSANLTIMPVDERFGPYDHTSSNSAAMRTAGFDPKQAMWIDILSDNPSIDEATARLAAYLSESVAKESTIVATLGIGSDGHTAGILPGSIGVHSPELAVWYHADDYERITLTASALRDHCDYAFVSAFSEGKKHALESIIAASDDTIDTIPALVLNELNRATLFTDQLDEKEYS